MNKIYILLLALLVMAGCYKDKGNYDYKTMYAIEIDGIDENKNMNSGLENLLRCRNRLFVLPIVHRHMMIYPINGSWIRLWFLLKNV